jgi:hypothetical protein
MLVIYTFELAVDQSLPIEMTVRIPARVGDPTAVAVLDGTQLVTTGYTRVEDGEWAEISIFADSPVIHLEYYDSNLSQEDQPRTFDFEWEFDYPINDLIVSVKQPTTATEIQILPALGAGLQDEDGLVVYRASMGSLAGGETFAFSMSYQKDDNSLASQSLTQPEPELIIQPVASGGIPAWGWAVLGAGLVLLVGGGVILARNNQVATTSRYREKKQRPLTRGNSAVFCHQCGQQAMAGDKFCRECGTKLRL